MSGLKDNVQSFTESTKMVETYHMLSTELGMIQDTRTYRCIGSALGEFRMQVEG